MTIQFGDPVSLDDLSLSHIRQFPIWVWAWEAGKEEEAGDESWQCPVIGTTDVTSDFAEPVITVKVKGSEIFGSASYNNEENQLEAISLWENGGWVILQHTALAPPIVFVAVPTIGGVSDVEFTCRDPSSDRAHHEG